MSEPQVSRQGMLPGMAAISIFLLFIAMVNGFHALRVVTTSNATRYSVLAVCTMVLIGVFGFLRLRRWGWSLVSAGCVLGATGYFVAFHYTHLGPMLIQGLFLMLFFLYLVRPEVRDRVH